MVEGKFGNRTEALVPRLRDLVLEAAERCNNNEVAPCNAKEYHIITPGWSLALGITSVSRFMVLIYYSRPSGLVGKLHIC